MTLRAPKLTDTQMNLLRFLSEEPDGGCPVNALPQPLNWFAYANCRKDRLISQRKGRGGFNVATITPAGRAALNPEAPHE